MTGQAFIGAQVQTSTRPLKVQSGRQPRSLRSDSLQ